MTSMARGDFWKASKRIWPMHVSGRSARYSTRPSLSFPVAASHRRGVSQKSCGVGLRRQNRWETASGGKLSQDLPTIFHFQSEFLQPEFGKGFPRFLENLLFLFFDMPGNGVHQSRHFRVERAICRGHVVQFLKRVFNSLMLLYRCGDEIDRRG